MKNYKSFLEHNENDPYNEEIWDDKMYYSFDEFFDLASDFILDKFGYEYSNYADDDQNVENFYYANVEYWSDLLKKELS
jgi:hypothetical protein